MSTPGHRGDETIKGDALRNKLWGLEGDDKLFGYGDNDLLFGGTGDDKLFGGTGSDKLFGGTGNDQLTGGKGADTFVFDARSGKDVVTDFDIRKDVLQIARTHGIKKPADVLDHAKQHGKDVVIDLGGGNKVTLKNIDLDDLKKHPGDHFDITG
jgi:Ca2+-binding RTX toxin-like protein